MPLVSFLLHPHCSPTYLFVYLCVSTPHSFIHSFIHSLTHSLAASVSVSLSGSLSLYLSSVVPNCGVRPKGEKRFFLADQQKDVYLWTGAVYKRPVERGFVTNWETESSIWERVFGSNGLNLNTTAGHNLLLTEPCFAPSAIQKVTHDIVFEQFEFGSLCVAPPAALAARAVAAEHQGDAKQRRKRKATSTGTADADADGFDPDFCVVIDSGYSFTHIVPMIGGVAYSPAVRRIDVGGKLLTNYLKQIITFR
jgi:actin-related protein 6